MASKSFCRGDGANWTFPPENAPAAGYSIYSSLTGQAYWGPAAGGTTTKSNVQATAHPTGATIVDSVFTVYESVQTHIGPQTLIKVVVDPEQSMTVPTGATAIDVPLTHKISGPVETALAGKVFVNVGAGAQTLLDYSVIPAAGSGSILRIDLNATLGAPTDCGTNTMSFAYMSG